MTEVAWAAGFFDGEGCTFLNRKKVTHYQRPGRPSYVVSTPTLSICQVDRRPLDRFAAAIGIDSVKGPYKPKTARSNPYFRIQIMGRDRVCAVLTLLWPFLSPPKREQARRVWLEESQHHGPKSPSMPALPEAV